MFARAARNLVDRSPVAKQYLSYVRYWRETRTLLADQADTEGSGAVFFTSQKCASTYLVKAFDIISRHYRNIPIYNFEGLYWHTRSGDIYEELQADAKRLFGHANAIYGPIREYVDIPNLEHRPVVLMLRDPRDVLVSAYYSIAHSHVLPGGKLARQAFIERRARAQNMTVDEYVFVALDEYGPKYQKYADHLLGRPNVEFITYEQLMSDFAVWANRLLTGLGMRPDERVLNTLHSAFRSGEPSSVSEDVTKHRRQGLPGDFRRKLQPKTIVALNVALRDLLNSFQCWEA